MFKLGEYEETEARSIAAYLKDVGIKVDLKPAITAKVERNEFMEGRLSELRGLIQDFERYERYLNALKDVLAKGVSSDELMVHYLSELFPSLEKIGERATRTLEASQGPQGQGKISGEELTELLPVILEATKAYDFAMSTLSLNEIDIGEHAGKLDDPVLAIPVDLEKYEEAHKLARTVILVRFEVFYDLYIDEFSTVFTEDIDEEFGMSYSEEYIKVRTLGMLLLDLIEAPTSEKMDLQAFRDACTLEVDTGAKVLAADGSLVAEEIAKVLEKKGIIKIKGDKIRWRKAGRDLGG